MRTTLWAALLLLPGIVQAEEPLPRVVEFNRDVRPILSNNCFHCHGPAEKTRQAELRFDQEQSAKKQRDGEAAIVPGDIAKSNLWKRITSQDSDIRMPPPEAKKFLSTRDRAILKRWIEQGAKWQGHWAFLPPKKPAVPKTKFDRLRKTPIDAFAFRKLEREGLAPSAEARKELLLRRVTFDLTGLPPTLEEIDAFLKDTSPNAYEKVVDRLLKSPHYGERMALMWMDAARYGDTSVFHADGPRDMWPWRDWVIRAYNRNLPFDKFTTYQLAGDQVPGSTLEQKIASGFLRNNATTDEGGVIPEEFRVEYAVDRVKTTSMVWLGLTMECGQCHDHKYDPITQKDYYRFFAFFNQSADKGMQSRRGNSPPLINVPDFKSKPLVAAEQKRLELAKQELAGFEKTSEPAFQKWLATAKPANAGAKPPTDTLLHFAFDGNLKEVVRPKRKVKPSRKPQFVAGKLNQAIRFPGNLNCTVGDVANFERGDKFSYGAWVKFDKRANGAIFARMDEGKGFRGWDLWVQNRSFAMHFINTWPANAIKVVTKKRFAPDQWHHVFVTYDGSSKAAGVKIYVNGKPEPWNIEANALKATTKSTTPLKLGSRSGRPQFRGALDDLRIYGRELSAAEVKLLMGLDPIGPILAIPAGNRTPKQISTLRKHWFSTQKSWTDRNTKINNIQANVARLDKPIGNVMVMGDVPKFRMTYLLTRGQYNMPDKKQPVQPGVPRVLGKLPKDVPPNRYGLARWLTSKDHPLTARVAVNRYWQMFFGTGIVSTPGDFGSQGAWPSHPELLDWLAVDFVENGWNVKRTLKQIVMSHTYRQTARLSRSLAKRDPNNRLLARGPRFRLQGEFIRDQALEVSGLLVRTIGGKGVKPYQPPGLWNEVSLSGNVRFRQDKGENLYRRSMYTYWKRSAPAPAMLIFDTPTRESCVIARQRTNTPLQALVTLNDPQFVEASRAMAQRVVKRGGTDFETRIRFAYRLGTTRQPSPRAIAVLKRIYDRELAEYKSRQDDARKLLSVGESKRDETIAVDVHAAWTIVCNTILNLDASLVR